MPNKKLSPQVVKGERLKAIERRIEKQTKGKKKSKRELQLEQQLSSMFNHPKRGGQNG